MTTSDIEHQTPQADSGKDPSNKDLLVLVPLLGSALAITYDVGYFSGVDINLFTMFSLSEHIVFALQVLPEAVVMVPLMGWLAYSIHPNITARVKQYDKVRRRVVFAAFFLICLPAYILVSVYYLQKYVLVMSSMLVGSLVFFALNADIFLKRALFVFMAAVIGAFGIGYTFAVDYLHPTRSYQVRLTTTIETKSDGKIDVWLIRSGDRGVLFLDKGTGRVALLRWDEIKKMSTDVDRRGLPLVDQAESLEPG